MADSPTEPRRRSPGDAVTEWAFAAGWQVVKWLPERAAYRAFDLAADALWRRRGGGILQFERNQARIHPELTPDELAQLSRRGMRVDGRLRVVRCCASLTFSPPPSG